MIIRTARRSRPPRTPRSLYGQFLSTKQISNTISF